MIWVVLITAVVVFVLSGFFWRMVLGMSSEDKRFLRQFVKSEVMRLEHEQLGSMTIPRLEDKQALLARMRHLLDYLMEYDSFGYES